MVVRVNGSTGIVTVSGTSGAPSLRGPDGNSGISFDGDQVIISSSGLVAATFSDSAATINNLSVDTTTLEFSPGSSGTPTVAPSGDLNTGIYFPAADTIGFAEGGNEAARIDSSGRLLVGTTNVSSDSTAVLVGRSDGATSAPNLRLEANFTPADGNSLGALLISQTGQTGQNASVRIEARRDGGTWTSGTSMPGRLEFRTTADGASSPTEQMRLTSTGNLQFNSGYGSVATAYGVRAWASWRGDISSGGDSQLNGAGNVSSVTDNGTGDYTINFTNAMPDQQYVVAGNCIEDTNGTRGDHFFTMHRTGRATGSVRVNTINTAGTNIDDDFVFAAVFR